MIHELKTWPVHFADVAAGRKSFELRKADRRFAVGDTLHLREWDPERARDTAQGYTGHDLRCTVTHILQGPVFGLTEGYYILSIAAARMPKGAA